MVHAMAQAVSQWCVTTENKKGKGHPCTGTEALYKPYGP